MVSYLHVGSRLFSCEIVPVCLPWQGGAGWDEDGVHKPSPKPSPAVVLEKMDVFTKFHDEDKVSVEGVVWV